MRDGRCSEAGRAQSCSGCLYDGFALSLLANVINVICHSVRIDSESNGRISSRCPSDNRIQLSFMGIFSFGKKGEASSERSSGRSRTSRGSERRSMGDDGVRAPAAGRTRRSSAVGQEAMLDPTLPEKQRARRRLVGAIALVMAAVIVLPMVLDSHPKPATGDIAISIPDTDQSDDTASAGDHAAAKHGGNGASTNASGVDQTIANGQDDSDPAGAAAPDSPPPAATGSGNGAATGAVNANANADVNADVKRASAAPSVTPSKPSTDSAKSHTTTAATVKSDADTKASHAKPAPRADTAHPATAQPDASADPLGEEIARRSSATASSNAANASLPPTPATPGSRYVVQLGQFSGDTAARDWVSKLKNIGVPAYIEHQKQADGSTRVMLRAGPFADRSTAQAAVLKVRQAGLSSAGR